VAAAVRSPPACLCTCTCTCLSCCHPWVEGWLAVCCEAQGQGLWQRVAAWQLQQANRRVSWVHQVGIESAPCVGQEVACPGSTLHWSHRSK
jgi:hypothetical protein